MPEYPHHQSLHLQNFTVFQNAEITFSPGVNVFTGENGSGKTHLLKAMYACQRPPSRDVPSVDTTLLRLFQTETIDNIIRASATLGDTMEIRGRYDEKDWFCSWYKHSHHPTAHSSSSIKMGQPVFIPALDMMGHTKGFQEAYNSVFLDFDQTCYDVLNLFRLKSRAGNGIHANSVLSKLLGGDIVDDESTGRFYLQTATGRVEMPMVAEGLRKIASLVRLQNNNWLVPGTTLYWDEPEANINPVLMGQLVEAILTMARQGVQIFLTTHSYVILKELDLQATAEDIVKFFSLRVDKAGTQVTSANTLAALHPNLILQQYGSLYDRDIRRATGRKPGR